MIPSTFSTRKVLLSKERRESDANFHPQSKDVQRQGSGREAGHSWQLTQSHIWPAFTCARRTGSGTQHSLFSQVWFQIPLDLDLTRELSTTLSENRPSKLSVLEAGPMKNGQEDQENLSGPSAFSHFPVMLGVVTWSEGLCPE